MPTSDEPASKRMRTDIPQDLTTKETLECISEVQSEIDRLNENASEEIINVEKKYNKLRRPVFEQREKYVANIANFWLTSMLNHPGIANMITEDDAEILRYLKNMRIEEHDDIKSGYKVTLQFESNPYFQNDVLEKDNSLTEEGDAESTWTEIKWKDESTAKKFDTSSDDSFFGWFQKEIDSDMDDLGDMLKDDLWPNPLQYYEAAPDDDEDADEDDDDDLES